MEVLPLHRSLPDAGRRWLTALDSRAAAMASEEAASIQDFLDRSFQSVASRHMDLKQREVDTAAAKVDELSKQLESLWTDNPSPAATLAKAKERFSLGSVPFHEVLLKSDPPLPSSPRKSASWEAAKSNYIPFAFAGGEGPQSAPFYGSAPNKPSLGRPVSPRPSFFLQPELDRSPLSPAAPPARPKVMPVPYEPPVVHASSPRSLRPERQYDYKPYGSLGREGSPRMPAAEASGAPQAFFPDRVPSPRPPLPPPYESHNLYPSAPSNFAPFRAQDDLALRRRGTKGWNESDLDVAYEKKSVHSVGYDRGDSLLGLRQNSPGLSLAPWRESSLDGSLGQSKEGLFGTHSATLPRNYKVGPPASERRPEASSSFRRSLPANPAGTLPRNWQPVSRIPMPPPGPPPGLPQRHKPLPLSMIFRLQNAFWEYGNTGKKFPLGPAAGSPLLLRSLQKQVLPQAFAPGQHSTRIAPPPANEGTRAAVPVAEPVRNVPITLTEPDPELEGLLLLPGGEASEMEALARPLSPTRLQPVLPPEAQKVPEFEEVARVLAEMPRPLKRRGSMEQSPGPALPPTHKKQYQQIISRLFHHQQQPPRKEEPGVPAGEAELPPISEAAEQKAPATATALGSSPAPATPTIAPASPLSPPPPPDSPVALTPLPSPCTDNAHGVEQVLPLTNQVHHAVRDDPLVGSMRNDFHQYCEECQGGGFSNKLQKSTFSVQPGVFSKVGCDSFQHFLDHPAFLTIQNFQHFLEQLAETQIRFYHQTEPQQLQTICLVSLSFCLQLNDPSQPNDEGITALHNAICGANYNIVDFLINIGANVNSPDSHGWTPLHCAASCNDTAICIALVKHGAAIFATTFSDGSMAIEKCDPYREGYNECFSYLADVEQSMGLMNNGAVYALWDYSAEFKDELSFREGEPVTVLRRDGAEETDWWWASLYGQEGYVPKNYFGLFPRVRPQPRMG
nr:PREDICTED: relA-associated inhibitor [Anolis carolinensis]|eukprot:XP_016854494.1 PREDICTED: relA-associated inhibitor [Anolis carolinensis]